jgi:peptidoglycan/LPS O-acetylase OafA/YrhL
MYNPAISGIAVPAKQPAKNKNAAYLSNLTPLRGIAALLTVIYHSDIMVNFVISSHFTILKRMHLMVDFFFILSGFIMCHVYGSRFQGGVTGKEFKKFTIARFSRVYPLHLVTLVYLIIMFGISGYLGIPKSIVQIENSAYSIFTNLFLLHSMNFHQWFTWVHASWSISTEWWAYMLFPFLVVPFMKLKPTGRFMICMLCFGGYLAISYFIVPIVTVPPSIPFVAVNPADISLNISYQYGFLRCLSGFILGMMMYQGYREGWGKKMLGNGFAMFLIALGVFGTLQLNTADIITVSFFPLLLLAGAYGSKNLDALFKTKPLQKLGDWSFSIYLVHQPILYTAVNISAYYHFALGDFTAPPPSLAGACLITVCFIAVTLFFSFLSYRLLEVPARIWLNKKAGK